MLSLAISLRPHLLSRSLSSAFMASPPPPIKGRFCGCRCMAFLASGVAFASVSSALHSPLLRDAGAAGATIAGAYNLVKVFDSLAQRGLVHQKLSRKIVHVLSGLLFMLSWPIFSSSWEARYFAALAPLANSTRLLYYGLALATNESLVKSVSREGKPEELLRGPLYFVMVLMFCALVFWRESPVGIISLSMMSGGDGFADIMGRRFGVLKLPYNQQKSWVGSISMFVSGFFISIG
ncbi:hypothetical protein QJS04_geneDACA009531 [Acorus gramineus]|uniref:phytol kinase n=1 Tax=Acorus gramineus TaxID=55184 RepID=A0AAV9AIA3_ACOGR|nr:hypothetical protein QJS04_geneDACA009531 [Acorus gramineus]